MVLDLTSQAKSVCYKRVNETKFLDSKEVKVFFAAVVIFPLMTMAILALIVRTNHKTIETKITNTFENGYHNIVGITLMGTCILIYVLCMDIAAVIYYDKVKKYYRITDLNISAPVVTLTLDLVITGTSASFVLYLCCVKLKCPQRLTLTFFRVYIAPYFFFILGSNKTWENLTILQEKETATRPVSDKTATQNGNGGGVEAAKAKEDPKKATDKGAAKKADEKDAKKVADVQEEINVWVVVGVTAAPLFCFASHWGYLIMALIIQPVRTTSVALYALVTCLYLFFMYRQCYILYDSYTSTPKAKNNKGPGKHSNDGEAKSKDNNENQPLLPGKAKDPPCDIALFYVGLFCFPFVWVLVLVFALLFAIFTQLCGSVFIVIYGLYELCRVWICYPCCKYVKPGVDDENENRCGSEEVKLNYLSFLLTFCTSWLIVIPPVLTLYALVEIPVSTYTLIQYLEALSQIVIVVVGLLVTYKVFYSPTESEIFMRAFIGDKKSANTPNNFKEGGDLTRKVALKMLANESEDGEQDKNDQDKGEEERRLGTQNAQDPAAGANGNAQATVPQIQVKLT